MHLRAISKIFLSFDKTFLSPANVYTKISITSDNFLNVSEDFMKISEDCEKCFQDCLGHFLKFPIRTSF